MITYEGGGRWSESSGDWFYKEWVLCLWFSEDSQGNPLDLIGISYGDSDMATYDKHNSVVFFPNWEMT